VGLQAKAAARQAFHATATEVNGVCCSTWGAIANQIADSFDGSVYLARNGESSKASSSAATQE